MYIYSQLKYIIAYLMSSIPASLLKAVCEFDEQISSSSSSSITKRSGISPVVSSQAAKQTVSYVAEDLIPRWSNSEKSTLIQAVQTFAAEYPTEEVNWQSIAARIPNRQPIECLMKYRNELDMSINRGQWSRDEEMRLVDLTQKYRCRFWALVAEELGTQRTPLECLRHYQQSFGTMVICNNESWSKEEDEILMKAVVAYGEKNWQHVANALSGRTRQQCLLRYRRIAKSERDGFWSDDEERRLFLTVISHFRSSLTQGRISTRNTDIGTTTATSSSSVAASGPSTNSLVVSWMKIARQIPGRQDSQCREKWSRALDPMLNSSKASAEEDVKIMELVAKHGVGNWSVISQELPGRNDKFVFKRWKLLSAQGDIEAFHAISRSKRMTHFQHGRKKAKTELQPGDYEASVLDPRAGKGNPNITSMLESGSSTISGFGDNVGRGSIQVVHL